MFVMERKSKFYLAALFAMVIISIVFCSLYIHEKIVEKKVTTNISSKTKVNEKTFKKGKIVIFRLI